MNKDMKDFPKVSVIIPTYKRPHLIGRAVQSVLTQTYQNFEIVIVDDSPNDESEKAVKKIGDKRIKYIRNQVRRGFVGAKNQGVAESSQSSEFVAFLDDDDEYLPLFLERTICELEARRELAAATTYSELRTQDGKAIRKTRCNCLEFWRVSMGNGCVLKKWIFNEKNIWFDEKALFEDLDLGIRIAEKYKWRCIPEVLRVYYGYPAVKGDSHSTSFTSQTASEEIEYFYKKNVKTYKKAGRKALGWVHFITGKTFCRAGKIKEGRKHLGQAFIACPRPEYLFYYLLALLFPSAFQNLSFIILKHKIFKNWIKSA